MFLSLFREIDLRKNLLVMRWVLSSSALTTHLTKNAQSGRRDAADSDKSIFLR
ncbi:hypothetical protein LEP1GSC082_2154 [Leptospira kirschneri str. H2]|uniref:hypothetical protein n=1 Tax=Leptospira kirschneri TaxID=29507 RepID=UPI0002928DB7|nr:hypothetical protein [Leptospira kirschneri]EKO58884.1 hypothetical protein LEP1GSC082_2154 [Leptospira kirschneri str. H2]EMJ93988.1 hypothetical protein LEP1GSC198_3277 [Leptospira kirschneri str. JB]